MNYIQRIRSRASKVPKRIILSEGTDDRVILAAIEAIGEGFGEMTLLGSKDIITQKLLNFTSSLEKNEQNEIYSKINILDPENSDLIEEFAKAYLKCREKKIIKIDDALEIVKNPLVFAALSVHLNYSDGTVGGAISTTSDTVRTALSIIGLKEDKRKLSSFFLIDCDECHHKRKETFIFADCGVVINPSVEDLANSAIVCNDWFSELVGDKPVVGMLSFSTLGSARHPLANKVIRAKELVLSTRPDINIEGELQFDSAFDPLVADIKSNNSKISGSCNVFIFPNLDTANIAYKIAERMAGAVAIGPILDGLKKPANDVSRGCNHKDIVNVIAITNIQAQLGMS